MAFAKVISNHGELLPEHWRQCFRTLVDVEDEFFQCDSLLPVRVAAASAALLPIIQHRRTIYCVKHTPEGVTRLEIVLPVPGTDAPRRARPP